MYDENLNQFKILKQNYVCSDYFFFIRTLTSLNSLSKFFFVVDILKPNVPLSWVDHQLLRQSRNDENKGQGKGRLGKAAQTCLESHGSRGLQDLEIACF